MDLKRRGRQLFSLIRGAISSPFSNKKYAIKRGYKHRTSYFHFNDIGAKDEAQKEVYETAFAFAKKHQYKKVLDIGCGSAYKLITLFGNEFEVAGTEVESTYQYLVEHYPKHQWYDTEKVNYQELEADLIICSDVIEHVVNPDELINDMKKVKNVKHYFISTPDRLLARNWFDFGPPNNKAHIREWNGKEFFTYMSKHFNIENHQITNYQQATQLVIATK